MNIERTDLDWAVGQGLLEDKQANELWVALQERHPVTEKPPPARARFDLANLLYFFGAMIVIGAMGWFMGLGWESFGGFGISGISIAYVAVFVLAGLPDWSGVEGALVSMAFGAAMLAVAFLVDQRTREDYAFWLYLFGMFAFWGGMVGLGIDGHHGGWNTFCVINVGLMVLSPLLDRRVFVVFGGLGVSSYLSHLSYQYVDSALFPFVLSFVGLGIIFAGIQYQRWSKAIDQALITLLPEQARMLLPRERARRPV